MTYSPIRVFYNHADFDILNEDKVVKVIVDINEFRSGKTTFTSSDGSMHKLPDEIEHDIACVFGRRVCMK